MNNSQDNSINMSGISKLHRFATTLPFAYLLPNQNTFQSRIGSLSSYLQPLSHDVEVQKNIAHTSSNPLTTTVEFQYVKPKVFYDDKINLDMFNITLDSFCLRVPNSICGKLVGEVKKCGFLQTIDRIRSIQDDYTELQFPYNGKNDTSQIIDPQYKRILLNIDALQLDGAVTPEAIMNGLPDSIKAFLNDKCSIEQVKLLLTYDYFNTEQTLSALQPENITIPSALSVIGHIGHLNLRDEQLPYKYIIGRVIVDKHNALRTVVNKVGQIDNVFRNFQAEILHGDNNLMTTVKEYNQNFTFDFGQVYWNSRLHTEHTRVVELMMGAKKQFPQAKYMVKKYVNKKLTPMETKCPPFVLDLFGGIGPFALPAASEGCFVWSNDINPRSALYMYRNTKANKLTATAFNNCGRQVMQGVAKRQMAQIAVRVAYFTAKGHTIEFKHVKSGVVTSWKGDFIREEAGDAAASEDTVVVLCDGAVVLNNTINDEPLFYSSSFDNTVEQCLTLGHSGVLVPWFEHTIMNLPASATTFLDMYVGVYGVDHLQELANQCPIMNDAHAKDIADTEITDDNHVHTYFNHKHAADADAAAQKVAEQHKLGEFYQAVRAYERNGTEVPCYNTLLAAGMKPFVVHCYLFARSSTSFYNEAIDMCEKELQYPIANHLDKEKTFDIWQNEGSQVKCKNNTLPQQYDASWVTSLLQKDQLYIHYVRNVAPLKEMMCAEIVLNKDILLDTKNTKKQNEEQEPEAKRRRSE